jgi:hypothetical protein
MDICECCKAESDRAELEYIDAHAFGFNPGRTCTCEDWPCCRHGH